MEEFPRLYDLLTQLRLHFHRQRQTCALSETEYLVLACLRQYGPLQPGSLGNRLGLWPSATSRVLTNLENKVFPMLRRELDEYDKRCIWAKITDSGLEALAGDFNTVQQYGESIVQKLSPDDWEVTSYVVEKLLDILEKQHEQPV